MKTIVITIATTVTTIFVVLMGLYISTLEQPKPKGPRSLGELCALGDTQACEFQIIVQKGCKEYYDTKGARGDVADCAILDIESKIK